MNNIIKKYESVALSNFDILKMLDDKVKIVLYPQLKDYNHIDDVLGQHGACILLFEAKPKYGHWCSLFKINDNEIEFFNSYGGFPDDSLKYIPKKYRIKSGQDIPILSFLLMNSPYKLFYNEFPFQKINSDIKTCGRHCVVRLILRGLDIYQYKDFLDDIRKKYDISYDKIVTLLTI